MNEKCLTIFELQPENIKEIPIRKIIELQDLENSCNSLMLNSNSSKVILI